MSEPVYGAGRARPTPPTQRIPSQDFEQPSPRRTVNVNGGRLWAGGVGTAIVVALVIVVGVMLVRGIFQIPVLAAEGAGAYGTATTTTYALAGAVITIAATALLHLFLLFMPRPMQFFYWICVLVTAVAVLLPFTFAAELDAQVATAAINLVAGAALMSILGPVGGSAVVYNSRGDVVAGYYPPNAM
ncbi:MAG TPA: hypothetical protein H9881_11990 [Candidatus Stackebrandtia excrementipullorum]|nr:hypothetical protein [Candidatus Stackebrandtia excrementipullorum]